MTSTEEEIKITTEYITLGQLLKLAKVVSEGGQVKAYLAQGVSKVNGVPEARRGKKLRPGDVVELPDRLIKVVS